MNDEPLLVCKECGGREFTVVYEFVETTRYWESLECTCGQGAGPAAERAFDKHRRYRKQGRLGEDHRITWQEDGPELLEESEEELMITDYGEGWDMTGCGDCFAAAALEDWDREEVGPKTLSDDCECFVCCTNCHCRAKASLNHDQQHTEVRVSGALGTSENERGTELVCHGLCLSWKLVLDTYLNGIE